MSRRGQVALAAGPPRRRAVGALVAAPRVLDALVARTEARMCPLLPGPATPVSDRARALHATLRVADLHADSLLFGRDLLRRGDRGHVDVPRLIEGRVALQVLSMAVKTPRGLNIERNDDSSDEILTLALAKRWPPSTWRRLLPRVLYLAERAHGFAAASGGTFRVIETRADLARLPRRPRGEPPDHGRPALDRGRARARRRPRQRGRRGRRGHPDDLARPLLRHGVRRLRARHRAARAHRQGPRDGPADGGPRRPARRRPQLRPDDRRRAGRLHPARRRLAHRRARRPGQRPQPVRRAPRRDRRHGRPGGDRVLADGVAAARTPRRSPARSRTRWSGSAPSTWPWAPTGTAPCRSPSMRRTPSSSRTRCWTWASTRPRSGP